MELDFLTLKKLSEKYGDSFYLLDSEHFRSNYIELRDAFQALYNKTNIGYSYKTNYTPYLCSIVNNLGGYAEVVSEMEYDLAIRIGVKPDKIIVNGPYKPQSALIKYFKNGSIVNLDSNYEVEILREISKKLNNSAIRVGIRCNFRINDKYTSRFGFDIEGDYFKNTIVNLQSIKNVKIEGIHCHFPDRILDLYETRIRMMLKISTEFFESPPRFIDVGGGYFGKMPEFLSSQFKCQIPAYNDYAQTIAGTFNEFYKSIPEKDKPELIIEPGTAVVADTMNFVTTVIDIKKVSGKYIAITSGSRFNLGAFASTVQMPVNVFNQAGSTGHFYDSIDISGYTCIENDYLYSGYKGVLEKNSFLVFSNIGSYSIVFKPPFILPNFPIIDINKRSEDKIIKRKESMDDIFLTYTFI